MDSWLVDQAFDISAWDVSQGQVSFTHTASGRTVRFDVPKSIKRGQLIKQHSGERIVREIDILHETQGW